MTSAQRDGAADAEARGDQTAKRRGRRALLTLAAVTGAAAAGARLLDARGAEAAVLDVGDPIPAGTTSTMPNRTTNLTGSLNAQLLQVINTGTGGYAPALVGAGRSIGVAADARFDLSPGSLPAGTTAGLKARGGSFGVYSTSEGVTGTGPSVGVFGLSQSGVGLVGFSNVDASDVSFYSAQRNVAVLGRAGRIPGSTGIGVEGLGAAIGVFGQTRDGIGVRAYSLDGEALRVEGKSTFTGPATFEGAVTAASLAGQGSALTALDAANISSGVLDNARLSSDVAMKDAAQTTFQGEVRAAIFSGPDGNAPRFSTGGIAEIAGGQRAVRVRSSAVGADSAVLVTLQGHPGRGVALSHVRKFDGGFVAILTGPAARATKLAYFVLGVA